MSVSADTATLLTPPGPAAIAVVRLAGPGVARFLEGHFSRPTPPGRCVHGTLVDGRGDVVDDPVVVMAPTGDFADISLHGGAWVVQSVLELARTAGFRRVTGSIGDVLVDAADVLEREVLDSLPLARTDLALRVLLAQPAAWASLHSRARRVAADAGWDAEVRAILADRSLERLLHPPCVTIVGAPNVGKSTLANQLFGQERSITADLPGTTRDWVGEIANVDGLAVMLVDTPGVRETADDMERAAIDRSAAEVRRADLVILVLDASRPFEPEQEVLRRAFPNSLAVVNKVDRPAAWDFDASARDAIRTVASAGDGVGAVREAIRSYFGAASLDESRPRAWTERQRLLLTGATADTDAWT